MAAPRKDNVKNLIIAALEKLIEEKDLNDVSLADIAKLAGVSKGTIYYYYNSKEDILIEIMDRFLSKQWDDLIAWSEDEGKDSSLHRFVMYVLKCNIIASSMRVHLIFNALHGNEAVRKRLILRYGEFADLLSKKIEERSDRIDGKFLAWSLLLASDGIILQQELNNENFDIDFYIDKFIEQAKRLEPKK